MVICTLASVFWDPVLTNFMVKTATDLIPLPNLKIISQERGRKSAELGIA